MKIFRSKLQPTHNHPITNSPLGAYTVDAVFKLHGNAFQIVRGIIRDGFYVYGLLRAGGQEYQHRKDD